MCEIEARRWTPEIFHKIRIWGFIITHLIAVLYVLAVKSNVTLHP